MMGYQPVGQAIATACRIVSRDERLGSDTLPLLYANREYRTETEILYRLRREVMEKMAAQLGASDATGLLNVRWRRERHRVNGGMMMVLVAVGTGVSPVDRKLAESPTPSVVFTQEVRTGGVLPSRGVYASSGQGVRDR